MLPMIASFPIVGTPLSCERYGSGHINETYLLKTDAPHDYILQKINHNIFKDVDGLMRNIAAVTSFLYEKTPDSRRVLTLVKTKEGKNYAQTENGEYFRLYEFVTDSICLDKVESKEDFYQSAVAFGQFQNQLAAFPADTLTETIPHFHDTIDRYRIFHEALEKDPLGRAASCQEEIAFALAHEEEGGSMVRMLREGKLPLRVTHNDTKLNNVMLDARERTPLCVIDLDTVMPGLAGNDFGDSIRFGANTAAEDEKDLSKVLFSLELFEAYAEGFLSACGSALTELEIATLPLGAKLMTLECGVRFLTDHLLGDTYFRIHRENHNLDRCRTQFKLIAEMEMQWAQMESAIEKIAAKYR
ncbi:MAG: aminoglycoside phosphotransferase family protein [Clostridiales bacterium]|nr:aminoglycoside phosphotransferase family protein [Clostridiales bacterium]